VNQMAQSCPCILTAVNDMHSVKRINSEEVEYRGWTIWRRDSVPTGYYGRYSVLGHRSFTTMRDAKAYIDQQLGMESAERFGDFGRD